MAAGDTIQLLTRYNVGAHKDPRENRLTAALVALLTESPSLARALAREWVWTDEPAPDEVAVRFQPPVGGNVGWVDFELDVRSPSRTLIWVEVKLGHRLSGANQLKKYEARIRRFGGSGNRLVLLMAPAQQRRVFSTIPWLSERSDATSVGPYFVAWQEVYGILARQASDDPRRGHVKWLLEEVLAYMDSEELKASHLTARHLRSLKDFDEAVAALTAVLERARLRLGDKGWKPRGKLAEVDDTYWEQRYGPRRARSDSPQRSRAEFSWGVDGSDLFAGVYFERSAGGPVRPRSDEAWMIELQAPNSSEQRWELDDGDRDGVWVARICGLKDVLSGTSVEAQADEVASFVDRAFSMLLDIRAAGSAPD